MGVCSTVLRVVCIASHVGAAVAVQRLIEEDKSFVQPAARRNEVLGWVEAGLRDFSISRAAVSWGIPIPRDPAQTVYVWFDALLGYMSGKVISFIWEQILWTFVHVSQFRVHSLIRSGALSILALKLHMLRSTRKEISVRRHC